MKRRGRPRQMQLRKCRVNVWVDVLTPAVSWVTFWGPFNYLIKIYLTNSQTCQSWTSKNNPINYKEGGMWKSHGSYLRREWKCWCYEGHCLVSCISHWRAWSLSEGQHPCLHPIQINAYRCSLNLIKLSSQHEYKIDWAKSELMPVKAGCIRK